MYQDGSQRAYSQGYGTTNTNYPVLDNRDPTANDVNYPEGKFWINQTGIRLWYLNTQSNMMTSTNPIGALQSTWELISVGSVLVSLSDTANDVVFPSAPSATPPDNIQLIAGAGMQIVSNPSNNSITFTNTGVASTETLTGNTGGAISPIDGNINTEGGTTIYTTGDVGSATLTSDVVSTVNTILVGTGATTASVPITAGTTNTVLLGHTSAPPSFGPVPNGALVNSSVTLNNGNNITVTGGTPLVLGGTASFNLTGTTNNAVQLGNSSGSLTSLSLVDNGVLISSSSGIPSWLADGTTGQVLTATAGSPPSWANIPSVPFSPNATMNIYDDFAGAVYTGTTVQDDLFSQLSWGLGNASITAAFIFVPINVIDNGHPGILQNPSTVNTADTAIFLGGNGSIGQGISNFILGGGSITMNWVIKIVITSNATNRYIFRAGFGDTPNADQANGVYFEYSDNENSGNWVYKTASSSTRTTSNSSVAVTTGWHNLSMTINAAASSVSFAVDGVSLGAAITTHIPTVAITPFIDVPCTAGTMAAGSILVDLFYLTQNLTTSR